MPIRRIWVPLNRISPNLRKAVVISEDDTFWEHDGFNFSTMRDALERNLKEGRLAAGGQHHHPAARKKSLVQPGAFHSA